MSNRTDALVARLTDANKAYRAGNPIMSDAAYDALEDELRKLDPNHPYLAKVGAPLTQTKWAKVAHSIPMGSLKKCLFDADAAKAGGDGHADLKAWWPGKPVCVTHKLDGISISLVYRDRKLVQAITRGEDGTVGEDILANVLQMEGAVKMLPKGVPDTVYVRGEIICRKSNFAKYFPGEANTRNTAAGTAKRWNSIKAKYLTVVAYQYLPDGLPLASKYTEIDILRVNGFVVPAHYMASTVGEVIGIFGEYVASKREALDWDIDGLVVDVDDRDDREALGSHNMRPNGARALKFPHASAKTILRKVAWQVGKSGRITPVAIFDPVPLAGAQVARATLHGIDYIDEILRGSGQEVLAEGDEILVERRGDVIPGVAALVTPTEDENAEAFGHPTECPECKTATERDGAYLVCPNKDTCPAQVSGAIKRWVTKIGVKHFGDSLIEHLCETGQVETIVDLYKLDPDTIAMQDDKNGRKIGGNAVKAFRNLKAKTKLPLHIFVGSLGIPHVGRGTAEKIVNGGFDSLRAMTLAKEADIARIPGVGDVRAKAFLDGFWDLLDQGIITGLRVHVSIAEKASGPFSGKTACMTGFRDAAMVAEFEAQGGVIKSSVSKGLTMLVAKDPASTSGKAAKARKYGVEIIGIDEMWGRLGGRP